MPTAISTTTTTSTTISENINNSAHRSLSASSSRRARPSSVRIQNSSHSPNDKSSAKSALRTLYDKAKHAFLQRDLVTADKLLNQAFLQLPPPPLSHSQPGTRDIDGLDSQRRKWDILRITLWTTLFVSRGDGSDKTSCPVHLAPYQFLQKLHSNSLRLFTPTTAQESSSRQAQGDEEFTANIGNVPDQVVFLLIVSALKLDELRVAKEWIEDWLVRRDPSSTSDSPPNTTVDGPNGKEQMTSYEKIVDVYVLHVLPRLGLWDDATEFLRYETEMNESVKQRISNSLNAQHQSSLHGSRTLSRSREASPTPSLASSTSTIPAVSGGNTPPRPASAASISSSASTATVRPGPHQNSKPNTGDGLAMTSLSKLDKGKGRALSERDEEDTSTIVGNGKAILKSSPHSSPSARANGVLNGTSPLPIPPLYQNGYASSETASKIDKPPIHARHLTSVIPFMRSYIFQVYLYAATILNTHFALQLPTDELEFHIDPRFEAKPRLWHVFFLFTFCLAVFRMVKGGKKRIGGSEGAGVAARKRLLQSRQGIVGPSMGIEFWKAAMRAVGDAVGMAGRGLV